MKKRQRILIFLILTTLSFSALLWFQANRLLRSFQLQELLSQKIQTITGGMLQYDAFEVGFSPQPGVTFINPRLIFSDSSKTFEAEKLRFDFDILPLAFGHAEHSGIYVFGGKADAKLPWGPCLDELHFRNFTLKMGALHSNLAIPLQFESDIEDNKTAVFAKGYFMVASVENPDWNKARGRFLIELKEFPLKNSKVPSEEDAFFDFKKGTLNTSLEVNKKENNPALELSASGRVEKIVYEARQGQTWTTPPALDITWSFSGAWDVSAEELKIQKLDTTLPFGELDVNGDLKLRTGEISKLHLSAANMILESLLLYWPSLEETLPFHIGFSGKSNWMLSLEGTLDHLSLHFNLDLSETLLSYGTYFTKAKDVPLSVTFDYLIQKGETLSGDFSVRFRDMSMKGNLTDLNLTNGVGQLNLLTNKFPLKGWEQNIPVLSEYQLDGNAKILANWKGDLRRLEQAEQIFHVTIEKGNWLNAQGEGIKNATLSFDYSPLMFEGRGMQLELEGSPVSADVKVTNIEGSWEMQGKVASGELDPVGAWESVTALFQHKKEIAEKDIYDYVKDSILELFPKEQRVKDLSVEFHSSKGIWEIQKLHALAYSGIVDAIGSIDLSAEPVTYRSEGDIKGVDFASFLDRDGNKGDLFEGTLSMKFNLDGSGWGREAWSHSLKGFGKFTLLQGRSPLLNILDPLSTIQPFANMKEKVQSLDAFEQLDFSWHLDGGKISTSDFLIKNSDHIVDGEGTIDFDGLANFRWDVFLPTSLAAEIFPEMASAFLSKPKAHFGPVPMLVSGPISEPDLRPDPDQVTELLKKINQKKSRNLLYELVLD